MDEITLQFLYGSEFWEKFEELVKCAKKRIFFSTAYLKKETLEKYLKLVPKDVYQMTICRDDNNLYNEPKANSLLVKNQYFHGKIYLIDDTIILGSQNLYNAGKEGEFSVLLRLPYHDASTIFYQSLLKIIERERVESEPVDERFFELYNEGFCPFCGNAFMGSEDASICPEYGEGHGIVSFEDCKSYGDDGACKYCIDENRKNITECYFCDNSGCGFGIEIESKKLLFHAINPPEKEDKKKAFEFLRLFNFLSKQLGDEVFDFFKALDLKEKIYHTSLKRPEIILKM
ncbi:MAG: hypothetical protein ACM3SY_16640 [Candidatus Omnitrophota bacterium]